MATLFTNIGKQNLTVAWAAHADVPKYISWGSNNATTASLTAASTNVGTKLAPTTTTHVTGTPTSATVTTTGDTLQVTGTVTAGGTLAVTEVGLHSNATGSNTTSMCIYGDFSVINLSNGDSIAFTIKTTFS